MSENSSSGPHHRPNTAPNLRRLANAVIRILDAEFSDSEMTLDAVGRRVGASPRQVQRALGEIRHTKYSIELRRRRLSWSVRLLVRGWPVGATAEACGFKSPSAFTQAFRGRYGVTPSRVLAARDEMETLRIAAERPKPRSGTPDYYRVIRRMRRSRQRFLSTLRTMPDDIRHELLAPSEGIPRPPRRRRGRPYRSPRSRIWSPVDARAVQSAE